MTDVAISPPKISAIFQASHFPIIIPCGGPTDMYPSPAAPDMVAVHLSIATKVQDYLLSVQSGQSWESRKDRWGKQEGRDTRIRTDCATSRRQEGQNRTIGSRLS